VSYQVEIGGKADAQLAGLDIVMGAGVERKSTGLRKTPPAWCIAGLSACRRIWLDSASSALATTGYSTGFIRPKSSSAFTASSTVPKSIAHSEG
jgi:hypothetical protein